MAEVVVPRNAQLVALVPIVVLVTPHLDAINETCHRSVIQERLPRIAWVDHAGVGAALDQELLPS